MKTATHPKAESALRYDAPAWAKQIWANKFAPTFSDEEVRARDQQATAAPEPPQLATVYVEDAVSVDDVWTGRFGLAVVALMALYMAGHFIAAWAAGRL